ncbi:MAG TPA: hypothetical protein DEB06_08100 [Phycisphaerales bacterium]|nr:hypothetical protein [Phycisphaerales bacterium]
MTPPRNTTRAPAAFTLIELLVVIAVVGVLIAILLGALSVIARGSQRTSAERLLGSVATACEAFKNDLTYLPPLLAFDDDSWKLGDTFAIAGDSGARPGSVSADIAKRGTIVPEGLATPGAVRDRLQRARFGSEYSIGVYLLGAGDINFRVDDNGSAAESPQPNPGVNTDQDDGQAGPGFRDPGPDRSWAGAGSRSKHKASRVGRVYGPYLDPGSLGSGLALEKETGLYKLLDTWGQPVRYYRNWPVADPDTDASSVDRVPVELRIASSVERHIDDGQANLGTEHEVLTASFMLVSAGRPIQFYSDGSPRPVFGDRKAEPDQSSLVQNMANAFNPQSDVPAADRDYLLEALRSNIRVSR